MTNDPLQNVTKLLADAVRDPGDVGMLPNARGEAIERLATALRERARQRRRRQTIAGVAAVAAVVALGAGLFRSRHQAEELASTELGRVEDHLGALTVVREGRPSSLGPSGVALEGTELQIPANGEANLVFASGTKLTMHGDTRVRLVEQAKKKRFALANGALDAQVAKLGADERFVVATPDAEIEVHGTRFRVSIVAPDLACAGGTPTRLVVTEGVVSVRHAGKESFIAAGDFWPRCTPSNGEVEPPPHEPSTSGHDGGLVTLPVSPRPHSTHRSIATPPSPLASASSPLAEQNDLYGQAMRERQGGNPAAAAETLERFLALYPDAALAESARLQRMRALAMVDRVRAVEAAKDYMQRYPAGFGRAEAEALATGTR
jgi:hypothetical protein